VREKESEGDRVMGDEVCGTRVHLFCPKIENFFSKLVPKKSFFLLLTAIALFALLCLR